MHAEGSECSPHRECFDSIAEAEGGERVSQSAPHRGALVGGGGGKADAVGDLEQLEPR